MLNGLRLDLRAKLGQSILLTDVFPVFLDCYSFFENILNDFKLSVKIKLCISQTWNCIGRKTVTGKNVVYSNK